MTAKLFFEAIAKIVLGIILVGALIFLPAGTRCILQRYLCFCQCPLFSVLLMRL